MQETLLRNLIVDVPDFPKPGILFKDITPLFEDSRALTYIGDEFTKWVKASGANKLVALDARGFLIAPIVAYQAKMPLVIVRKPGKLPQKVISVEYELEYGSGRLEMTENSIKAKDKVFVIDDLLATGGTAQAACRLIEQAGGSVAGLGFIIELLALNGRQLCAPLPCQALIEC